MSNIEVSALVAMAENTKTIGVNGKLPWHIPADLLRFKTLTLNRPVIMGRKTYESIGRPLPQRTNIVVTRDQNWSAGQFSDQVIVRNDLVDALRIGVETARADQVDTVYVIGGEEIYRQAFNYLKKIYMTIVHADVEGDAHFNLDLPIDDWAEEIEVRQRRDESADHPYSFVNYTRTESMSFAAAE